MSGAIFWLLFGALSLQLALSAAPEVVAWVGSEKIEDLELQSKLALEERNLNRPLSQPEKQALLQSLLNQRLLVAQARADGLHRRDDLRRTVADYERQLLANLVYESEVSSKVQVSEEELKGFYAQNPKLFELRQVSQILVQPLAPSKFPAARRAALRIKEKLAVSPQNFAEMAKGESDDLVSRDRGGDLGTLRRGMMLPELEKVVFKAKPGSIVGPVQTQFGFHVLQVRSARKQEYEEAKEMIAREIKRLRSDELQQKLLQALAKRYKVQVKKPQ